jgi:ubiquinone/menaquinone biosynthesis C-methylase UbiE/uncharacterized protein YbaR (Trm112 family)
MKEAGATRLDGPSLSKLLACPVCRETTLEQLNGASDDSCGITCATCDVSFPVRNGIPILLPPHLSAATEGNDGADAGGHKHRQALFADTEANSGWEVSRPHGAPALYIWVLEERFRRSIGRLHEMLREATVLTVCGGSGLDAEFLARAGARVVASDISFQASLRARERARRYGLPITPIVADAENLPFADSTFDLVYVHDGLHHLEDPIVGLTEMARVSAHAVSVNEPARAAITSIAVRLGLALDREEAGNRVARVTLSGIVEALDSLGFRAIDAHRYGIYYKHEPGWAMRWLSKPGAFSIATGAVRSMNAAVGRFGNKVSVQAVRARRPRS